MAVRNALPFNLPEIDGFAPAGKVAEVRATTGLDQQLRLAAQGDAPKQRHALKVNGKSRFGQTLENHLQHSPKECRLGEFRRWNVP
jgi:hypothetical protein